MLTWHTVSSHNPTVKPVIWISNFLGMRTTVVKRPWTEVEKEAVQKHLGHYIRTFNIPGKRPIDECLAAETALESRNWKNVKDFVRNLIREAERKMSTKN